MAIEQPMMGGGVAPGVDRPFHDPAPGVRRQVRIDVRHMDDLRQRHDDVEAMLREAQDLERRAATLRRVAEHLAQGLMRWLVMEYHLPMDQGEEWLLDVQHMVLDEAQPLRLPAEATPAPDPAAAEPDVEAQAEALESLAADDEATAEAATAQTSPEPDQQPAVTRKRKRARRVRTADEGKAEQNP